MPHAKAEDVKRLASAIKDQTLGGFLGKSEAEYMVIGTIHAAVVNLGDHGEPFSFRGANIRSVHGGGLVDNNAGYQLLLDQGLIVEDQRHGRDVIFPTCKLVEALDEYLCKMGATP